MSNSWPIVFAVVMLVAAAFWYDSSNASANPGLADSNVPAARTR